MRIRLISFLAAGLTIISGNASFATKSDDYKLGPDSSYKPGVPKGTVSHHTWTSKIFPGTVRDYWIYVPAQYNAAKPASVMIFQDGGGYQDVNGGYRIPVVFDNLINEGSMPVTIAIMINPGVVPADRPDAQPRYNRSYEYDAVTDRYARFLMDEILPEVGKTYNLSKDPNDRALSGGSSGGIASFVGAWTRPDAFRRVLSFVGSFTNLRGGHDLAWAIRKFEPRPLRVFLQDGSNDQDIYSGSWFIGNNDVAAALKFAGYESQYVVGDGGHNGRHGGAILPDALRWLWKDHPSKLVANVNSRQPVQNIIRPGEGWEKVGEGKNITALAGGADGSVLAADNGAGTINQVNGGTTSLKLAGVEGIAYGTHGELYASVPGKKRVLVLDASGKEKLFAAGRTIGQIAADSKGRVYGVDKVSGEILRLPVSGKSAAVSEDAPHAFGICFTPDQQRINVSLTGPAESGWSYHVTPEGALTQGQEYFDFHAPYGVGGSEAAGLAMDVKGWLYTASTIGIQIVDQPGRVNSILNNPSSKPSRWLAFGGPNREYLYATDGTGIYRRHLKSQGALSQMQPIKPQQPRL